MKNVKGNAAKVDDHRALHKYIRIVSTFCDIAGSFNARIEALTRTIDTATFNQILDATPMIVEKLHVFDWLHADITPYKEGGMFRGIVSFVSDPKQNICFIKDVTK